MAFFTFDGLELQDRDFDVLCGLFECRVMTLGHVAQLYFDGRSEAAKKRVQKLKTAGLLRERRRRVGDPSVLHIGRKAFGALRESGRLDRFPAINATAFEKRGQVSDLTLRHELEVMDVRAAFFRAVRERPNLSIVEFCTWPSLYQFTARYTSPVQGRREVLVKPDGFVRLLETTEQGTFEHLFFLEVDRSTESQEVIAQKAACYLDYYQSGGLARRFNATVESFKDYPFRVLMVFKTSERQENALRRLLRNTPPIRTQVWATTSAEIVGSVLKKIWWRPMDIIEHQQTAQSLVAERILPSTNDSKR